MRRNGLHNLYKKIYFIIPISMCGIIGFIGKVNCIPFLIIGLKLLQNRGYDSAGICIMSNNKLRTIKYASTNNIDSIKKLEENKNLLPESSLGIAHTRWATHGKKTDENAHPHLSMDESVAVVHNGIIENYLEIKSFLMKKGFEFRSQTDTEVIAQLLQYFLQDNNLQESLEKLCNTMKGTWACLIQLVLYPNLLIAIKNGSPLLFAKNDFGYFFTSEVSGFQNQVDDYLIIKDKAYYIVDNDNGKIHTKQLEHGVDFDELIVNQKLHPIDKQLIDLSPEPYPHWMIKEIYEQVDSSNRAINYGGRLGGELGIKLGGLDEHKNELFRYNKVCFLACGTSYHASMFGSILFTKFGIFESVKVIDASEFYEYNYENKTLYIVLSQSGETKDVHRAMEIIKNKGGDVLSVVNVVESLIAREALCGVYVNAGSEKAVASTKSFVNQVIVLVLIGMWWYKNSGCEKNDYRDKMFKNLRDDLGDISKAIKRTIDNNVENVKNLAKILSNHKNMFILGRGLLYPIAMEVALKIKEVSYIHAEGFCGGALKHGPFALIEENTPIFILSNDDTHASRMESAGEEVNSRGAYTILVTNNRDLYKENIYRYVIEVPKLRVLSGLLSVIPMQLLSYEMGILKGVTVDQPKSLAKVVTVDG